MSQEPLDVLFLDANVLFSAAYRPEAGIRKFWTLSNVRLITSAYAVAEAHRNLKTLEQRADLERLLAGVEVVATVRGTDESRPDLKELALPDKDTPIMLAAVDSGSTHLITGDFTHFGPYYGEVIAGVLILPPASYLRRGL